MQKFFVVLLLFTKVVSAQENKQLFYLSDTAQFVPGDRKILADAFQEYTNQSDPIKRAELLLSAVDSVKDLRTAERYYRYNLRELSNVKLGNLSKQERDRVLLVWSGSLNNLGHRYYEKGIGDLGLSLFFKAKRIVERANLPAMEIEITSNIANLFYQQDQLDESLKYMFQCEELNYQLGDSVKACYIINNVGVIYGEKKEYEKSIETLEEAYALAIQLDDIHAQAICLNNLGGSRAKVKDFDRANEHLKRSLELFKIDGDKRWLGMTYAKIASVLLSQKDSPRSHLLEVKRNAREALKIGEEIENKDVIRRALQIMHKVHSRLGEFEEAYEVFKRYTEVKNQLSGERQQVEAVRLEAQYRMEKNQVLDRKEAEKQIAIANADSDRQRLINYIWIGSCAVMLLLIIFVVRRLRIERAQKRKIELQNNERKLLLKEIHHRIKNNFQVVSSLLRLQASEENNERIAAAFDDAVLRIQSMASIHELIYKQEMFEALSIREYLDRLIGSIQAYSTDDRISISVETDVDKLNIKTLVPLGITINELVTNSMKYAFTPTSEVVPEIQLKLQKQAKNQFSLTYRDNGKGFQGPENEQSFGMELIETVIEQIDGSMERLPNTDWKNTIEIQFKEVV